MHGCHTPTLPSGAIDLSKAFSGGVTFNIGLPEPVYSANLTSDPTTGLSGWTPKDVVNVLHNGHNKDDAGLCPPMPFGPYGAFGGLTDADALDIGNYIVSLPPISNKVPAFCSF